MIEIILCSHEADVVECLLYLQLASLLVDLTRLDLLDIPGIRELCVELHGVKVRRKLLS